MEDFRIVELYFARSEAAIGESDKKYGRMLFGISFSLLHSHEDSEECVNDTYLEAWNKIPPERPVYLGAFLSKIVRCRSLDRFRHSHREKRGGAVTIISELSDMIPDGTTPYDEYENGRLRELLNGFLSSLDEGKRYIFLRRYFFSDDISEIAKKCGMSVSALKTSLHRMRRELEKLLREEGLFS